VSPAADLHVHTTVSDGSLEPAAVPDRARAAGLDAVAITDHDRLGPVPDAPVVERDGLTVVRGIELRVAAGEDGGERLDLLGYGVAPTDALRAEIDRLQDDRIERAARTVALVEERLGVDLDVPLGPGVGRPHVARAVAASDAPLDYDDAFAELIGDGGPCYVARELPSLERGLALLEEACGLVSLAHPYRYADPEAALARAVAAGVDAVERAYPYDRPVEPAALDRALADHDLLATGGSDAHDDRLGRAGLDRAGWDRVAATLPGAQT
jgi:predicted metal-dependent phosphoesterase TrpH